MGGMNEHDRLAQMARIDSRTKELGDDASTQALVKAGWGEDVARVVIKHALNGGLAHANIGRQPEGLAGIEKALGIAPPDAPITGSGVGVASAPMGSGRASGNDRKANAVRAAGLPEKTQVERQAAETALQAQVQQVAQGMAQENGIALPKDLVQFNTPTVQQSASGTNGHSSRFSAPPANPGVAQTINGGGVSILPGGFVVPAASNQQAPVWTQPQVDPNTQGSLTAWVQALQNSGYTTRLMPIIPPRAPINANSSIEAGAKRLVF